MTCLIFQPVRTTNSIFHISGDTNFLRLFCQVVDWLLEYRGILTPMRKRKDTHTCLRNLLSRLIKGLLVPAVSCLDTVDRSSPSLKKNTNKFIHSLAGLNIIHLKSGKEHRMSFALHSHRRISNQVRSQPLVSQTSVRQPSYGIRTPANLITTQLSGRIRVQNRYATD